MKLVKNILNDDVPVDYIDESPRFLYNGIKNIPPPIPNAFINPALNPYN